MDFSQLNYTLANEDSSCERILVTPHTKVACMAGSGSRLISLLAACPESICALDSSYQQILMSKFRLELMEQVEWNEYCSILGYPSDLSPTQRTTLFNALIFSPDVSKFLAVQMQRRPDTLPIYWGVWEQSMIKNAQALKNILGAGFIKDLLDGMTLNQILNSPIKSMRYKLALRMVGQAKFLAKTLSSKQLPQLPGEQDEHKYYDKMIHRAFHSKEFRDNFFLHLLFTGKINSISAAPDEANPEVFRLAKRSLTTTNIQFCQTDIRTANPLSSFDFVFFSDVFSYLTDKEASDVLTVFAKQMTPQGLIVMRFYRSRPNFVLDDDLDHDSHSQDLVSFEMTGAYEFCVLKRAEQKNTAYSIKEGTRCVLG